MVRRIRAHFDGRVIVPDEPLDLPLNQPLRVELTAETPENGSAKARVAQRLKALEAITGTVAGPAIPDEALRRENLYDSP